MSSKYGRKVGRKAPKEGSMAEVRRAISDALKRRGDGGIDWHKKKYKYGK